MVAAVDGIRSSSRCAASTPGRTRNTSPANGRDLAEHDQRPGGRAGRQGGLRHAQDTLHLVDLVYNPDGGRRPEVLITDQGSYSDIVFAIVTLLGFDYRPVLADLPDAKLWRIDPRADYGPLDNTARGRIDLDEFRGTGRHPAHDRLHLHRDVRARRDPHPATRRAADSARRGDRRYGRIFKTLHVLTFVDDPAYRRQLKAMRNLQEGRHDLARHIFHGRKGELHRAYHAGMEDQLGALGLVLNCVTLWNTLYLDRALTELRAQGYPVTEADAARSRPTSTATSTSTATTRSPCPTSAATAGPCAIPTRPARSREPVPAVQPPARAVQLLHTARAGQAAEQGR